MKQEYKISMKLFAFVMAILMLLVSLPVAAYANIVNTEMDETSIDAEIKTDKQDVIVLEEDEALRDENIKHFKLSDGTTKAVVYSQAVHYKDADGKWIDIDNALTLNGSEYSSNNKQTVKFANKSDSNGLVSIKDGDYKIDFTPLNTNKVKVEIENPQENNSRKFEHMSQLDNLISKAIYKNIYDKTDIEYILIGNNLKENIIVKEKQNSYTFTFALELSKLNAELKDGAIILSDYDSGEQVYEIPVPYMVDANNVYSDSVEYSLVQDSKWKYTFTVTADAEWINAEERTFPVTIDPMIYTDLNITDTYFESNNDINSSENKLVVGDYQSSLDCYTFVKYGALPEIPNGAIVTDARIFMYAQSLTGASNLNVAAYRVTNSWTVTTSHEAATGYFNENTPIDYVKINSVGAYEWDITELFKQWKSGVANHGIAFGMMEFSDLEGAFVQFASFETIDYTTPKLQVSYTTVTGLENYYSYYQSLADMAGTGYVNAFTGNLTFVHNIFTTADEIMPFSLYATYNSDTKSWRLNTDEAVEATIIGGIQYYKWTDGDGTEHWFAPYIKKDNDGEYYFYKFNEDGSLSKVTTPTEFYDQSGLGLKLTVVDGKFYISDDKGNKKEFTNGKLTKIEDTYGNARTFVTTGITTSVYLKPNTVETPILQLELKKYDADVIVENKQTGITAYLIDIYNLTDNIVYVFDDQNNYEIDFIYSNDYLIAAKNSKNNKGIQYSYTNNKVTGITEIANANSSVVTGNTMSISYGTLYSTARIAGADNVLNNSDDIYSTYRFDNSGRVITAYSHDSDNNIYNSSSYQYNDMYKDDGIGPKLHNSLRTSFINGSTTPNYLYNGAFENGITGWTTGGTGTVLTDVYDGYDTLDAIDYGKSLKMKSTALNTSTAKQSIYLTVGTYTLSASLYKGKMLDDSNFVMEVYNSSNAKIASSRNIKKEDSVYTFNDWEKETLMFDVSVAGNYTVIFKYSEGVAPTTLNYICVDEAMLERSTGNGTFSVYGNGGFEKTLWSNAEQTNAVAISTSNALQGNSALKLTSSLLNEAYYKETYNVCGDYYTSDHFVISAWAKASALPSSNKSNSNATFGIELRTYYRNYSSVGVFFVPFNTDCTDWQYVSQAVSLAPLENNGASGGNLEKIEIYLRYDYNSGGAYFDNVCFARSGSLTTYSYNSLGYVKKIGDSSGKFTEYNYNSQNAYELKNVTDQNGVTVSAEYDENHNIESSTYKGTDVNNTTDDITTDYTRNDFGQITENLTTHTNSQLKIKNNTTYVTDTTKSYFSRVSTTTDQKGMITEYHYNDKGQLEKIYYNNESGIQYQYNAYGQLICAIPLVYNNRQNKYEYNEYGMTQIEYEYNENTLNLDKIDANTDYYFEYDEYGNMTSFEINGNEIASYEYIQNNGNLKKLDYGNEHYVAYVEYTYDSLDRIIAVCYNGVEKTLYTYTPNGQVYEVTDLENGIKYKYSYDGNGAIINERATKNGITHYNKSYDYDDQGRIIEKRIALSENESSNNTYRLIYRYDSEGRISEIENNHINLTNSYSYDLMGNLNKDTLKSFTNTVYIEKEYEYEIVNSEYLTGNISSTTEYINGKEYRTEYTYDIKGNITQITYRCVTDNDVKYICYEYDKYNQLKREENQLTGYVYDYYYDGGGNLRSRDVWNYNNSQGMPLYYESFFYDNEWQDQITGYARYIPMQEATPVYQGTFTYDAIGNPLSYYNGTSYSFTWQNGRQLAKATVNGAEYIYKYNQDGIRLSKQYGNTLVEYIVDGTQIVCERVYAITLDANGTITSKTLTSATVYSYDANGTPNGARVTVYSGTSEPTVYNFFFRTNLQGDVLAIYDKSTKQQVVSFNYNAWGEYTTNVHNTTLSQIALNYTHLRYRGYYQDVETSFYYLNSRYYDSKMCKFINADGYVNANGDFVGFNMYAYCSNNPVMYVDPTGEIAWWVIAIIVVAVIALDHHLANVAPEGVAVYESDNGRFNEKFLYAKGTGANIDENGATLVDLEIGIYEGTSKTELGDFSIANFATASAVAGVDLSGLPSLEASGAASLYKMSYSKDFSIFGYNINISSNAYYGGVGGGVEFDFEEMKFKVIPPFAGMGCDFSFDIDM